MFFDLVALIKASGYIGLFLIIFAESGLFIGFFLPGDSLLFTAGFLASQDILDIKLLVLLLFFAAVFGDNVGYAFGKKIGQKIFYRPNSKFFNQQNLQRAHEFFEKYGKKAIVLARFVPVVRTFTPIVAGAAKMNYKHFFVYNVVGGLLWAIGLLLLGYFFGQIIPNADKYILPIILIIIATSFLPAAIEYLKTKNNNWPVF
jgi:membrane-associated protein